MLDRVSPASSTRSWIPTGFSSSVGECGQKAKSSFLEDGFAMIRRRGSRSYARIEKASARARLRDRNR